MFIGRQAELQALEELYSKQGFQMVVLYGRRRVGKTALLSHFCTGKHALYFTAEQKNDFDNLRGFSEAIWSFFEDSTDRPPFETWKSAFNYIADHCEPLCRASETLAALDASDRHRPHLQTEKHHARTLR